VPLVPQFLFSRRQAAQSLSISLRTLGLPDRAWQARGAPHRAARPNRARWAGAVFPAKPLHQS